MYGQDGHLLAVEGLSLKEYRKRNPGAPIFAAKRIADQQGIEVETVTRKRISDYVTPHERLAAAEDPDYEVHQDISDYVICREPRCGFKSVNSLTKHLASQHAISPLQYRRKHNLPAIMTVAALKASNERERDRIDKLRTAAWRPDGFDRWPLWQQKAGEYLLRNQGKTAPEVGRYLDGLKVPGPWGKSTAEHYARSRAGEEAFRRLRRKVEVPKSRQSNI
jgi:hypothetical protein